MANTNIYFVPKEIPVEDYVNRNSTFSQYARLWMSENKIFLATRTFERYESLLERINMGIGHIPICEITSYHIKKFLGKLTNEGVNLRTGKGLSEKTVLHHYRLISVIMQEAVRDELIPYNPANRMHMRAPKVMQHEVEVLQYDDFKHLLNILITGKVDKRVKTAILLMALTGIRRGECAGLQFGDFDCQSGTLSVRRSILYTAKSGIYQKDPKTSSSFRTFYISQWVIDIINDYKEWYKEEFHTSEKEIKDRKLFCQKDGNYIHPDTLTIWCRKFCENYNFIKFTPHILRHTYASIVIGTGASVKEVSARLGHSKLTTTCNIYTHSLVNMDKKVANALDFFRGIT